jgi:ribosomal-protein-alanine N-acetyltransferase
VTLTLLQLQPLTPALLDAALELDQLCFGGLWTRDGYQRELDSSSSHFLVLNAVEPAGEAEADTSSSPTKSGLLVGLGCFWSILEEAHITILGVHPQYQSQGLGQLLLYALLRDACHSKLEWATLEVRPSNQAALALYRRFGFKEAGRRRRYYKDTDEDALILWCSGLQTPEFQGVLANCRQLLGDRLALYGWQLSEDWDVPHVIS